MTWINPRHDPLHKMDKSDVPRQGTTNCDIDDIISSVVSFSSALPGVMGSIMLGGNENFEVQVMRDNRWVTESARDSEAAARQLAKKFLSNKDCAGARVIGNSSFNDGSTDETIIFERTQDVNQEKPARIIQIESPPQLCNTSKDLFSLESRSTINRVLRIYLERVFLTPTELLHSHKEMQRLYDTDQLVSSTVSHIAKMQTVDTKDSLSDRQDKIYAILDEVMSEAEQASSIKLPKITVEFSRILRAVSKIDGNTPEYLAMVALSRDLININSWVGKLDRLCKLATQELMIQGTDNKAILLLDTVIADVLGANVIQEILGWQRSLGKAIVSMVDLADGCFEVEESDAKETVILLNTLFAEKVLPASRHVILERAMDQLKSSAPLYRSDPSKELEEYQMVLARLMGPSEIVSGAKAAEAITVRGNQFIEQGGATGRRAAIGATLEALPDRARGVMYLAELSSTKFADDHLDDIVQQLDDVFSARVIGELTRRSMSPKERMIAATGAFHVASSSALPDPVKKRVADHIDDVLERYLVDADIIAKLDTPEHHIRDRAVRLVKFCGAGVLPEGKALTLARKRVIQMLRQPNFDVNFIEGLGSTDKAENALRKFHRLLVKAGIA
jgi:hypothetical protein